MEHLKEKLVGITLYEYYCEVCGNYFWISVLLNTKLNCPHCSRKVCINGILPIRDIKFKDEKEVKLNN